MSKPPLLRVFDRPPWPRRQLRAICLATLAWTAAAPVLAQHDHAHEYSSSELEVFLAADSITGHDQHEGLTADDEWLNADVVFGLAHEQFRIFGEYYVTPEEGEMERFEVGYEVVPDTMLWVGRFHQPASAWNTEHHHGRYLQTAITRPSIENWEDEEGLIPQHIGGALIDSRRPMGADSGIELSAGVGAAPGLADDGYKPITFLSNNPHKHGVSLSGRLAYLPDYAGTNSAGLLLGHDETYIGSPRQLDLLRSRHANLSVFGLYADWSVEAWRAIGATYYVDIALDRPTRSESFVSGYVQVERQLPHKLTVFGRIEDSARMQESHYVALFNYQPHDEDIVLRRPATGLRWDFLRRQAFTIELSHVTTLTDHAFELRLQWSAAIP